MHQKQLITAGRELTPGSKVLILLHGRGGRAEDILSLAAHLHVQDYTLLAPQATNHSWYPYSFMAPPAQNEPWLTSSLDLLTEVMDELYSKGLSSRQVYFLGFSQGACLALEFVARHATRYGGVVAFTGGLIGDRINPANYRGHFAHTPVFIGTSHPDAHVPVERVQATMNILKDMGAEVTGKVYNGMGHTINQDELDHANRLVFGAAPEAPGENTP